MVSPDVARDRPAAGSAADARNAAVRTTVYSLFVAAACLMVLASRVHLGFEHIRFRVVKAPRPAHQRSLSIQLPDVGRLAGAPAALVIRLQGTSEPITVDVALDGSSVTRVVLPPNREIRIDASAHVPPGTGRTIVLTGDRTGWQLNYLEIANVHGFTRGTVSFEVVPRDRDRFNAVPSWLLPPIFILLLALRPRSEWPVVVAARRLHQAGIALVLLLFAIALIADRFTPYKVLLSLQTFMLCATVLYAEHIAQVCRGFGWVLARITWEGFRVWRLTLPIVTPIVAWPRLPALLAGAAAITVAAAALVSGAHFAGGSDSFGYISQSELWARGALQISQPTVSEMPAEISHPAYAPLGYTPHYPAGIRGQIVPTYSPGLPLVMAAFRLVGGPDAVYLVVPALGGLVVWLTFVLGRRLDGDATGLTSALLMASSPVFLMSTLAPMSDVPVTAWWLLALVAVCRATRWSAATAGTATSLAILTRPNLAPLAVLVALPFVWRVIGTFPCSSVFFRGPSSSVFFRVLPWPVFFRGFDQLGRRARTIELGIFAATAMLGPAFIAVLFNYWYGSPLNSGYGAFENIYSWSFVRPNLERYPRWLCDTQTPLIAVGLLGPVLLQRRVSGRGPSTSLGTGLLSPAVLSWLMVAICVFVWVSYVAYIPFESWAYLRFVLPSYPALFVLASAVLVLLLRRTAAPRTLGTALFGLLIVYEVQLVTRGELFDAASGESRYRRVGEFARSLPDRSVLLSMQHSGSLRYYSGRFTLRYDLLPEARLDQLIANLEARGFRPYFVLDQWEEEQFRSRFRARNRLGRLDWPPAALAPGSTPVLIYDPRDRTVERPQRARIIP